MAANMLGTMPVYGLVLCCIIHPAMTALHAYNTVEVVSELVLKANAICDGAALGNPETLLHSTVHHGIQHGSLAKHTGDRGGHVTLPPLQTIYVQTHAHTLSTSSSDHQ